MGQQLHGGLVEEDPQVCPFFGSHDVVADVRRLSLAVPHPVKALQQFCFGHTRACVAEGAALFLMKFSSCGSAALGSKKVSGPGFSCI